MDQQLKKSLLKLQKNELSEYLVYKKLASQLKDEHNREVLERIANDELEHFKFLKKYTNEDIKPRRFKIFWYVLISKIFGLSFGLKLMEKGEDLASQIYNDLSSQIPDIASLSIEEQRHEKELLDILSEERLEYAGAMVLGLNDALVELTGALAGLTFALQNAQLVAITGFVTGIAASLSMAASGYLSSKEEADQNEAKSPLKAALYTGIAYVITVLLLITPYFIFDNIFVSLWVMLFIGILIIFGYTFYITTAKNLKFWKRFLEMAIISLTVALISFLVGVIMKKTFGVDL
ncbi:MAG: VIT1/CCC1 transporter family protein [Calditrichaceae bacterium]